MDIIQNQCYEINNLVTRTGRFSVTEFQKELVDMVNTYRSFSVGNGEFVITTTKAIVNINGEQIMDVEILLPVNYRIPIEEPFSFKSKLKLSNALYVKITDVSKLQDTLNVMNQYILDNKLQPITSAYLFQTNLDSKPCIEVYIGLNPNIL